MPNTKFQASEPNYSHAQIVCDIGTMRLLGDVRDCYHDADTGSLRLVVTHFNGKPWPLDPLASQIEVLTRGERE